jgi:hypothetical protein
MNVAICFYGLLRSLDNLQNVYSFYEKIKEYNIQNVDFYYSIPSLIDEISLETISDPLILDFDLPNCNFIFKVHDYNFEKYKQVCDLKGFPKVNSHNLLSARTLSMADNISKSINLVKKSEKYDMIILTRLDLVKFLNIKKLLIPQLNEIILVRSYDYDPPVAEDRFIQGDYSLMKLLSKYYNFLVKEDYLKQNLIPEALIYTFYKNQKKSINFNIKSQEGIFYDKDVTVYWPKYRSENLKKIYTN